MKTLAIFGAGEGLGLALAKKFGQEGFRIALIARNETKLKGMVDTLARLNIESEYFIADIYSNEQIQNATNNIKEKFGQIDVVEISPVPDNFPPTSVLELTSENARDSFEGYIASSINIVNSVLPDMLERNSGSLLFTTGFSAIHPFPIMGNIGIGTAGLRSYIANLNTALSEKNIWIGHRSLAILISTPGDGKITDPEVIANMWYNAYLNQDVWEQEYPKGITIEKLMTEFN